MITSEDIQLYKKFQKSPLFFIESTWKIIPQPVKLEYRDKVFLYIFNKQFDQIKEEYFQEFIKGQHLTWQQWIILLQVENAIAGIGKRKISVVSGHGIGKDATLSMLILWFLFCFKDAQIPCTAPTSELMHDVLWKEIKIWLDRMPKWMSDLYDWSASYIRIKESPETWFARARTARKEAPEALQGVHGDYVLIPIDEASGVPEEIYKAAEGSLTGENVFVILISNGTRAEGFFYDTHHNFRNDYECLQFNSEDSPIVDPNYIQDIANKYGIDSDEYKIRVKGGFPTSDQMDERGWIPLIAENQVMLSRDEFPFLDRRKMGVDPAGGGDNQTAWVIRDKFVAKVVALENFDKPLLIARKTIELMKLFEIKPEDVYIDNFGEGANVAKEIALQIDHYNVNAFNWGDDAQDLETYLNRRAECYFRARSWLISGGMVTSEELKKEIIKIRYKAQIKGKKQIMDKPNMVKLIGKSPDRADAFALTFADEEVLVTKEQLEQSEKEEKTSNPHSLFFEI